jgi:hypothetical protein
MTNPNPYAAPASEPLASYVGARAEPERPKGTPLHELTVKQASKPRGQTWTIAVFDDVLYLTCAGQSALTLDRRQFVETASLALFSSGSLILRHSKPPTILTLNPEALAALRGWLTPVLDLAIAKILRDGRTTALVLGVLSLVPTKQGLALWAVLFGVAWLAWAVAVTLKPSRVLFLAHAALWAASSVSCILRGIHGSPAWFIPLLFFGIVIMTAIKSYAFYGEPARPR